MIIDQLYETLYIHEWEEKYNNPDILDGEQWGVWIKLTENREKDIVAIMRILHYGWN